jgi:hypothetical protein
MIRTQRARPIDTGIVQGLRSHWKLLLSMTAVASVGIIAFEPDYLKLQTASDAADFRRVLVDPGRAMAAAGCDIALQPVTVPWALSFYGLWGATHGLPLSVRC